MKSLKLNPGPLPALVHVPGSKSYANRALILAALSADSFRLINVPDSTDVTFLIEAFSALNLPVRRDGKDVIVEGSFPRDEQGARTVEIGEGGTTARFFASLLLLGKEPYTLILGQRLKERPWDEFIEFVRNHGGTAELQGERLELQGPLKLPVKVGIDCSRTTQFASGFQLAFAWSGTSVEPLNLASSQSYWKMTEALIQRLRSTASFEIPLDWSSASYPMAFAALNHPISFPGLQHDPFQSDAKFLELLKGLGAVKESSVGIEVHPVKKFKEIELLVHDCLDLVPTLGYFLAHLPGTHRLTGIQNLVHKESDRLTEVIRLLNAFDRKAYTDEETLVIEGSPVRKQERVDLVLPDDHRMVMVGALFLRHHAGGSLGPSEAVAKSYPRFFELFS